MGEELQYQLNRQEEEQQMLLLRAQVQRLQNEIQAQQQREEEDARRRRRYDVSGAARNPSRPQPETAASSTPNEDRFRLPTFEEFKLRSSSPQRSNRREPTRNRNQREPVRNRNQRAPERLTPAWNCKACTYTNENNSTDVCSMCETNQRNISRSPIQTFQARSRPPVARAPSPPTGPRNVGEAEEEEQKTNDDAQEVEG